MAEEAEASDVRDRVRGERPERLRRGPVQLDHRRDRSVERPFRSDAVPNGLKDDPGPERLRQVDAVTGTSSCLRPDRVWMHGPDDGKTVLRLGVTNRVPSCEDRAGRLHALSRAGEHVREHLGRELLGERGDGQREQWRAAHREDVVERVRRGDRAEGARVVDEWGEEVDREDDRPLVVQPVDRRVVGGIEADEEVFRIDGDEPGEDRLEPCCRVLRSAAASARERGELNRLHVGTVGPGRRQENPGSAANRSAERPVPFSSPLTTQRPPPPRRPLC